MLVKLAYRALPLIVYVLISVSVKGSDFTSVQQANNSLDSFRLYFFRDQDASIEVCSKLWKFYASEGLHCKQVRALTQKALIESNDLNYEDGMRSVLMADSISKSNNCSGNEKAFIMLAFARLYSGLGMSSRSDSIAEIAINNFGAEWSDTITYIDLLLHPKNNKSVESKLLDLITAHDLASKLNNSHREMRILVNIGYTYANAGQFVEAGRYFKRALEPAKATKANSVLSIIYNNIAGLSSDYNLKLEYLDSAIRYAKIVDDKKGLWEYSENKALTYYELGDYKRAYDQLWSAMNYKDSLLALQKYEAVAELEEKYEAERSRAKIQELKLDNLNSQLQAVTYKRNQNRLQIGLLVAIVLLAISIWSIQLIRKNRNQLAIKNAQIQEAVEKSDNLLLNILPEDVARELKQTGTSQARNFTDVSILFTDFIQFTQISEKLTTTELVDEINACFVAFDAITVKYGIEKIKTIGDSYMAAAGLPQALEDSVGRTVMAAIEMQRFVHNRCEQLKKEGKPYFEMRAGIHCGSVVAGIVGERKFQYDIWGDAVNTASRMENMSEAGKVNISEELYQRIKADERFEFEERELMEVKGKGMMKMYLVSAA